MFDSEAVKNLLGLTDLPDLDMLQVGEAVDISEDLAQRFESYTASAISWYLEKHPDKEAFIRNLLRTYEPFAFDNIRLSQSLIKTFISYTEKQFCGLQIKEYVKNPHLRLIPETPSMALGKLFEYWATGARDYDGMIPDDSAFRKRNGELKAEAETALHQADIFKQWLKEHHFSDIETNKLLMYSNGLWTIEGRPDVITEKAGETYIIDLKLGSPDGRWGDFAWADDKLVYNEKLLLQPKFYLYMYWKNTGKQAHFIFYIADKSNPNNAKAREIIFQDFINTMAEFEEFLSRFYSGLVFIYINELWVINPELSLCTNCPILSCAHYSNTPPIKSLIIK